MREILIALTVALTLAGCVSQQELAQRQAQRQAEINHLLSRLSEAEQNTTVSCPNKQLCDKTFSLTKIYIQENADMKLQFSDDTTVSTYNPFDYAKVALRATRIPESGDSSSIKLVASCKGMDPNISEYMFTLCVNRVVPIYNGFKPFIESRIKP